MSVERDLSHVGLVVRPLLVAQLKDEAETVSDLVRLCDSPGWEWWPMERAYFDDTLSLERSATLMRRAAAVIEWDAKSLVVPSDVEGARAYAQRACRAFSPSSHGNATRRTEGGLVRCTRCGMFQSRHWLRQALELLQGQHVAGPVRE